MSLKFARIAKVVQAFITGVFVTLILSLVLIFFIPQCLDYHPYEIQTGSMEPEYPVGSMIYVKPLEFEDLRIGDIVTFRTSKESKMVVTHRLLQIDSENQMLLTKGDANEEQDPPVAYASLVGKATEFAVPKLGRIVRRYQDGNGRMYTLIGIVFLTGISFLMDLVIRHEEYKEAGL